MVGIIHIPAGGFMHYLFDDTPERCPDCGTTEALPIVYGAPSEEMIIASQLQKIVLGGPDEPEDGALWRCQAKNCRRDFS